MISFQPAGVIIDSPNWESFLLPFFDVGPKSFRIILPVASFGELDEACD